MRIASIAAIAATSVLSIATGAMAAGGGSAYTNRAQIYQTNYPSPTSYVTPVRPPAGAKVTSISVNWVLSRSYSGVQLKLCGSISSCQTIVQSTYGASGSVYYTGFNNQPANQSWYIEAMAVSGSSKTISPALYHGRHLITVNYGP
jgi:hypothetical protein